jgi:Fur family iron response transcriptional regulator
VSKATVYNTLGLFANKGLVREVIVDPTRVMYDSNTSSHYHFYNVDTGELYDIEPGNMNVNELPDIPDDTEIDGVEVIVRLRNRS